MIEDTRLFSANNPIGRLWYYINILILAVLTVGVHIGITEYVLPSINESFRLAIWIVLIFSYFIFAITFFMLADRRLYDICGSRDANLYVWCSKLIGLIISLFVIAGIAHLTHTPIPEIGYDILKACALGYAVYAFIIGLIPGKAK